VKWRRLRRHRGSRISSFIEQQENFISTLLGASRAAPRGRSLPINPTPRSAVGLPSRLNAVPTSPGRAATHAANADIGVAKADYFPDPLTTEASGAACQAVHGSSRL
jgi:outer membrane protein TolC